MKKNLLVRIWNAAVFTSMLLFLQCSVPQASDEIPITSNSEEAINLFLEGRELIENIKTTQAAKLFDRAIALDPDFALAYFYRGFYSGGDYKESRENMSKAADLIDKVSEGEKHLILFGMAVADNDGTKQKSELNELLKLFPKDKRVQISAGAYYQYFNQNYKKSLEYYNNAVNIDPNYAESYNMLGYLNIKMNNYADAEKAFKKYISLLPNEANPYDSYAEFLLQRGKYHESITNYEKVYNIDPTFVSALSGIGNNYIFMGEFDKAREYYEKYYTNASSTYAKMNALFLKATSYLYEEKMENALVVFEERVSFAKVSESPITAIYSYKNAAFALDVAGQYDRATEYYKKAEDLIMEAEIEEADRITAQVNLDLFLCYHKIMTGKLEEAKNGMVNCGQIIDVRGNVGEKKLHNLGLGIMASANENYQQALEYFKDADRENPFTWYQEAITLQKIEKKDEAKKLFNKIVSCNKNQIGLAVVRNRAVENLASL